MRLTVLLGHFIASDTGIECLALPAPL